MADEIITSGEEIAVEEEQNVNELRRIRLEKLGVLQENGCDPFLITKAGQNIHSAEII